MKKTTWVIIGLSVCVVVLAAALVVVLTQRQAETVITKEPVILLESRSFNIAGPFKTKSYYYGSYKENFVYPAGFQESKVPLPED